MDPDNNPFTPGAGSQPLELVGRDGTISKARTSLSRVKKGRHSRSVLLYGLRGVGKTVLLNRIERLAAQSFKYETAVLEAPEDRSVAEIITPPLRQILLRLDIGEGVRHKVKQALGALQSFASVFDVKIGDVGVGVKKPAGTADSGILDNDITDLLVAVGEAAQENKRPVAIFVDEFQYVRQKEMAALLAGLHRVGQLNLPLMLFGAGLPQLVGFSGDAKSYAERLFFFEEVGALAEDDAYHAIVDPIEEEGARINKDAVAEIYRCTEGYPHFLQEWGSHTWDIAPKSPIRKQDVIAATPVALDNLDGGFFRVRFDRLTPAEKNYLRAMAELGNGPYRSGDIAAKLGRAVEQVAPIRARVISKGMAYASAHGETGFTVPMFDQYMKRVMPEFKPDKRAAKRSKPPRKK